MQLMYNIFNQIIQGIFLFTLVLTCPDIYLFTCDVFEKFNLIF